jgi:hypothetical protein
MKILLDFQWTLKIVDWNLDILEFPHTVSLKGVNYQWVMYDYTNIEAYEYSLSFAKITDNQLPHDGFGNVFHVPSIEGMFGKDEECDCGAKIANTTHAFWCKKGNGP